MRRMLCFALAGLLLASLAGTASADQSVERATPFSDYRQSATDEYTVTPGSGGGTNNTTSTPDTGAVSPDTADNPGEDNSAGGNEPSDQGDVSPATSGNPPATTVHAPSSGLPFTGLNLLTVMLLGVLLVAAGLALAALTRVRRRALAR
jgi:hypothetical protein